MAAHAPVGLQSIFVLLKAVGDMRATFTVHYSLGKRQVFAQVFDEVDTDYRDQKREVLIADADTGLLDTLSATDQWAAEKIIQQMEDRLKRTKAMFVGMLLINGER